MTPTQKTVETIWRQSARAIVIFLAVSLRIDQKTLTASAAFPPIFNMSIPTELQIELSLATAPSLPSP
jgi:hypothetical protein